MGYYVSIVVLIVVLVGLCIAFYFGLKQMKKYYLRVQEAINGYGLGTNIFKINSMKLLNLFILVSILGDISLLIYKIFG